MAAFIIPLFSTVSTFFSGLFGMKGDQAKTVQQSLSTLQGLNETEAQAVVAQANAIAAILTQGSFLERNWRAGFMVVLIVILVSNWLGYTPPNFEAPISPNMQQVWELLKIGLGGYIARYGIRDIVREFKIADIVKTLITKKIA